METVEVHGGENIRDFVKSRMEVLLDSYSILHVGHITRFVDPINSHISVSEALAIFAERGDVDSLPVEGDVGVSCLLHKSRLVQKKSALFSVTNPSIERFIDSSGFFVDANEHCEKAMARVLARSAEALYDDFMIYERGRFFGIGTFSDLSKSISDIRTLDLKKARAMQEFLISRNKAESSGAICASLVRMANEIGGDYLQQMDMREGLSVLACFDVCGKGTSAAILTGAISSFFSTLKISGALSSYEPAGLVNALNRLIIDQTPEESFVAAAFAFVDAGKREASFFNCGFPPLFVFYSDPESGKPKGKLINPGLWPLGINEYAEVTGSVVPLYHKFRFFMHSDGLTEALNGRGDRFGDERLRSFLYPRSMLPAARLVKELDEELGAFVGETPQADDITVLAVEVP
jgi:serine phosphatase RsbU (regulator of sigma subunit)